MPQVPPFVLAKFSKQIRFLKEIELICHVKQNNSTSKIDNKKNIIN